jgi:hypothetical protein
MPPSDNSTKLHVRLLVRRFLRVAAIVSFIGYCTWNGYWLAQRKVPPSIFLAVTGLPAPTTGGIRAVVHLWRGELRESMRYNAMVVPILLLLAVTLGWLICQAATRRRLLVPFGFFWAWLAVLGIAWVLKLTGDPMYW